MTRFSTYDLVIVGSTLAARQAAIAAASEGARVALVDPSPEQVRHQLHWEAFLSSLSPYGGDRDAPHSWPELWPGRWPNSAAPAAPEKATALDWSARLQRAKTAGDMSLAHYSPAQLALAGVDWIPASAHFQADSRLSVTADCRRLLGRAYLLLNGFVYHADNAAGDCSRAAYSPAQIWGWSALPQRLAILGGTPTALALASAFARLAVSVKLWLPETSAVYAHGSDTAHWILGQLEADGVEIYGGDLGLKETANASGPFKLTLGGEAIAVDKLIVAANPRLNCQGMGLETLGIVSAQNQINVGDRLQTIDPRLYVGGTVLGNRGIDAIAPEELDIALKNALFLPRFAIKSRWIPWGIDLHPEVAIVGVSQAVAQQWYGQDAWVLRTAIAESAQAQLRGHNVGFCQLVVHRRGDILGAVVAAPYARVLIQPVVQAMANRLSVNAIACNRNPKIPFDLIGQTADQWRQRHRRPGQWRLDWQENWFNWRRPFR
ncbi:MAG: FAD-dependent oxidoreductase [Cyanobacteria bacterium P01_C01_bin.73]